MKEKQVLCALNKTTTRLKREEKKMNKETENIRKREKKFNFMFDYYLVDVLMYIYALYILFSSSSSKLKIA